MCAQHRPPSIVPERGKVTEDHGKSSSHKSRHVFHERVAGSNLTDNPRHLGPEAAALSVNTGALARNADVLAGEAAGDDIDPPGPWSPVELSDVSEDGELGQASITLSRT
jgi:hypothetical protein